MANDLSGPVWRIDTPSASLLYDKLLLVKGIRWVSKAATAGDDVEIVDAAGRVIWRSVASGVNYVEADATVRHVYGLAVTVLDSGDLFVEIFG